ncbi:MAG: ABC transporter permease [Solirubrobacteraceae bacterium]
MNAARLLRDHDLAFPLLLAAGFLIANLLAEQGSFGLTQQLANVAPLAIAAIASTPAIVGGGLDLSISPLIYFVNAIFIVWLAPHGLGGVVAVPLMLSAGAAVGALTGLLILVLRVDAIVVTLAMYFLLQGVDLIVAPNPVSAHVGWMTHLAGSVGPIPGGLITILVPLALWWALKLTPFRGYLYAIGSNAESAFSSGVNVSAVRVLGYALGGLFAGIGGIALSALVQSANAASSTEYTLEAIAAVTLGGISLAGGRGRLLGAVLGAFAIYLLQNVLSSLQIDPAYLQVVYGGMLIIAVAISGVVAGGWQRGAGLAALRRPRATGVRRPRALPELEIAGAEQAASERSAPRSIGLWRRAVALQKRFPVLQVAILMAIFLYGDLTLEGFGSWQTIKLILLMSALVGLASGGQTLLILMGGFDLSVAGFIVAGAVTTTTLTSKYHISFGVGVVAAVLGAGLLGAAAGQICHRFRIQPLIVTLAIGAIAVGVVQAQSTTLTGVTPQWLSSVSEPAARTFGIGIPPIVVIWAAVAIAFAIFLHRTVAGRRVMATGANARAAEYALISTRRVWTAGFAFSAMMSALIGILIAAYAGGVNASLGEPYLFQSVVAVVVGGTVFGGPGDYTRTCIGALLLTVLTTVLVGHGAGTSTEDVVYGLVILGAIAAYGRRGRLGAQV